VKRKLIATLLRALGIGSGTVYRRKPDGLPERPNKNKQLKTKKSWHKEF
jgi:hypothetical protein